MEKSLSTDQPLAAAAAHDALNRTSYPVIAAISFSHLLNDMMQSVLLAIYPLPLGLLLAGALIPRIGFGWTASLMLGGGTLLALAIGLAWRTQLWHRDAPGNRHTAAG